MTGNLKIGLTLAGIVLFSYLFIPFSPTRYLHASEPDDNKRLSNQPIRGWFDLQGNRGARGNRPENTLPAFDFGYEQRMTTLALDVNLTKDNQLILHHGRWINEDLCLDAMGDEAEETHIREMTVSELKQLDCGSIAHDDFPDQETVRDTKLITLKELFDYFKEKESADPAAKNIRFNIHVAMPEDYTEKDIELIAELLVSDIRSRDMAERTMVQSFELKLLPMIKSREKHVLTSAMFAPSYFQTLWLMIGLDANRLDIVSEALSVGADVIAPQYFYINTEFVEFCHDQNLIVIPWIANDEDLIQELIDDGVDGIISDYPARLYRIYSEWRREKQP